MDVYVSIHGRKIFHTKNCSCIQKLRPEDIVEESHYTLFRLGYSPCKKCISSSDDQHSRDIKLFTSFCKSHNFRYTIHENTLLINTDIGHWKIGYGRFGYDLFHGNSYPNKWFPHLQAATAYHTQTDVKVKNRQDLEDILNYIYEHDKFRENELNHVDEMPVKTKAQRKEKEKMEKKKHAFAQSRFQQKLDKIHSEGKSLL